MRDGWSCAKQTPPGLKEKGLKEKDWLERSFVVPAEWKFEWAEETNLAEETTLPAA